MAAAMRSMKFPSVATDAARIAESASGPNLLVRAWAARRGWVQDNDGAMSGDESIRTTHRRSGHKQVERPQQHEERQCSHDVHGAFERSLSGCEAVRFGRDLRAKADFGARSSSF
jgi:hypothetical protein